MPLLRDRDGRDWRSKLPPNPDADKVMSALSAMNQLPVINFSTSSQDPENIAKGSESPPSQDPGNSTKGSESLSSLGLENSAKGSEFPPSQDPENTPKGSESLTSQDPENSAAKGYKSPSSEGLENDAKGSESSLSSQDPEKIVKGVERDSKEREKQQHTGNKESETPTTTTGEDSSDVTLPSSMPIITSAGSPGEQIRIVKSTSKVPSSSAKVTMATEVEAEEEDPVARKAKFDDWKAQGNAHAKKVCW